MKKDILNYILNFELNPFSTSKTIIKKEKESIFKTSDAKKIHTKVLDKISNNFYFKETSNIWHFFDFSDNFSDIERRQIFFKSIKNEDNSFLNNISKPKRTWNPNYDVVIVTEDENTFLELQKLNCLTLLLINENDLSDLERYDVIQVIDCDLFSKILERLPQTVFINDISDIYLERYLEELSGWKKNFSVLNSVYTGNSEIKQILDELNPLFDLINVKITNSLSIENVEKILEEINDSINEKIKDMTITGESLIKILGEGHIPDIFSKIIEEALDNTNLPRNIFNFKIPLEIDYNELENEIKKKNSVQFTSLSEEIKRNSEKLKKVPNMLKKLEALLLIEDFTLGISKFITNRHSYPHLSENLHMEYSENMFLEKPQPIDFQLDNFNKCSILTGANSGGKTTLIEHIIQNISLFNLGLPIVGKIHMPIFTDIYYFAKNKGSANKGAFETLLTQMSQIKPGNKTFILADEIESVTEPGIAGKIIAATCEFFIQRNCFLIIATHLGYEIKSFLPDLSRVDGIEAKGLDENFNLIVDHNPIMGRIAHSTPELIIEKMSKTFDDEYFKFLNNKIIKNNQP